MAVKWRHGGVPLLVFGVLCPLRAQEPPSPPDSWVHTVAHYGKWPALAGSAGIFVRAVLDRDDARERRAELESFCASLPAGCALSAQGRYQDPHAAELDRVADTRDERARHLILAGELALIATGALFVIDLVHDHEGPPNIPFTPFRVFAEGDRVGLRAPL